jgi:hypothetical protein
MIAPVLPFNTFDATWPRLGLGGERVGVGREGWSFTLDYKNISQHVELLTNERAITEALKRSGIDAKLSEPGHIARQMLDQLGGLWGLHLLADLKTIQLLNKMAGGVRRKRSEDNTIEETFELRTATLRGGPGCLNSFSASISGASAGVRLPRGGAAY